MSCPRSIFLFCLRAVAAASSLFAGIIIPSLISFQAKAESLDEARGAYLRVGSGLQWPEESVLGDQDCSSQAPPSLFGCGLGNNGQPLGSTGAFQQSPSVDLAIGYHWLSWLRTEALLNWLPQLSYEGQSNFLGAAGSNQPVSASGQALAGFAVVYVDSPPVVGVRPFLGAGLGAARSKVGHVTYLFPGISANASTITQGGTNNSLAYLLTVGVSVPLNERIALDLAYRWTDYGSVTTRSGPADIVRPNFQTNLTVGSTKMDVRSQSVLGSLRFRF